MASLLAWGPAARSSVITCAAARVVDSFQPVSSLTATPRRSSKARMRRVSTRSWAIKATGAVPSPSSVISARIRAQALFASSSAASHRVMLTDA